MNKYWLIKRYIDWLVDKNINEIIDWLHDKNASVINKISHIFIYKSIGTLIGRLKG